MTSIQHRLQGKGAVCIQLDGDLLARQARFVAVAENKDFNASCAAACLEVEAANQFPSRKVVGLIDHGNRVRCIRKPNASELDVARDRIGGDRDRLDLSLRMFPRVAAEKGQPSG